MNSNQKRILAIHDISCVGKCSLTVALPVISACGIEVSVLPTALLSAHTGISGFTYKDLTPYLMPQVEHWQQKNIGFDAIYTGFLGSEKQVEIISDIFDIYKKKNSLIMVDPVMADNGALYNVYDSNFAHSMKKLISKADIIVPNITEAAILLGQPYLKAPYKKDYIETLIHGLSQYTGKIVLTGVAFDDKKVGVAVYDTENKNIEYILSENIKGFYHGTGDVFASALLATYLNGVSLCHSARIAVDFTVDSILRTHKAGTDLLFGVNFEEGLSNLAADIKREKA